MTAPDGPLRRVRLCRRSGHVDCAPRARALISLRRSSIFADLRRSSRNSLQPLLPELLQPLRADRLLLLLERDLVGRLARDPREARTRRRVWHRRAHRVDRERERGAERLADAARARARTPTRVNMPGLLTVELARFAPRPRAMPPRAACAKLVARWDTQRSTARSARDARTRPRPSPPRSVFAARRQRVEPREVVAVVGVEQVADLARPRAAERPRADARACTCPL